MLFLAFRYVFYWDLLNSILFFWASLGLNGLFTIKKTIEFQSFLRILSSCFELFTVFVAFMEFVRFYWLT